jgi:hypothetical protein
MQEVVGSTPSLDMVRINALLGSLRFFNDFQYNSDRGCPFVFSFPI